MKTHILFNDTEKNNQYYLNLEEIDSISLDQELINKDLINYINS